jgi:hypothetical protein
MRNLGAESYGKAWVNCLAAHAEHGDLEILKCTIFRRACSTNTNMCSVLNVIVGTVKKSQAAPQKITHTNGSHDDNGGCSV